MRELDETTPLVGLYQSIYLLLIQKVGGWLGTGKSRLGGGSEEGIVCEVVG